LRETVIGPEETVPADVLFLAGMDWRSLEPAQRTASRVPIVNLLQGLNDIPTTAPGHGFLAHPAIRLCVSEQIQEALESVPSVEGPIFTIPIGVDLDRLPAARSPEERDIDCVVLAVKNRPLGGPIAERLTAAGYRALLVDRPLPRDELLDALARARVTVHLPASIEGAYLPALESMALGAAVVCPDCVGNRSFCRDGDTSLVPRRTKRAIVKSALTLLAASPRELEPMLVRARAESTARALSSERLRFLEILARVEDLWAAQ
jgi:hypothetical protein